MQPSAAVDRVNVTVTTRFRSSNFGIIKKCQVSEDNTLWDSVLCSGLYPVGFYHEKAHGSFVITVSIPKGNDKDKTFGCNWRIRMKSEAWPFLIFSGY